jgi:hypothetical protein
LYEEKRSFSLDPEFELKVREIAKEKIVKSWLNQLVTFFIQAGW